MHPLCAGIILMLSLLVGIHGFSTRGIHNHCGRSSFIHREQPSSQVRFSISTIPGVRQLQRHRIHSSVISLSATKIEDATTNSTEHSYKRYPNLENDANLSTLTINNPTWDQNIAALLEYKELHGTVNIPTHSTDYPNLARWCFNLRRQKGRLTQEQVVQLDSIGFLWTDANTDKNERKWMAVFEELKQYKETHGNCLVPRSHGKLGVWVMNQRKFYRDGNLRRDRQELLDSIGFVWRLKGFSPKESPENEALWESQFAKLVQFKQQHGHTHVPRNYPDDKELSWWVFNQRNRNKDGTLRPDRKERLDKICFVWDFDEIYEKSWRENYEELKQCYEMGLAAGPSLRSFASNQRALQAKGSLDPERKELLDKINFEWWE